VREAILAHHPALPFTRIAEAVAYILASDSLSLNDDETSARVGSVLTAL
jgi:hypothetical protein